LDKNDNQLGLGYYL